MKFFFALTAVLAAGLAVVLFRRLDAPALYVAEGIIAAILICLGALWHSVVSPMSAIERGIGLLKSQDFASRLQHVGYGPADRIADTFNAMMLSLRNERLRVREKNQFLDLLAEASPMGIIVFDFDGAILSANPAATAMLGVKSPAGMRPADIEGELGRTIASLQHNRTATVRRADNRMYRCSRLAFIDSGHRRPFVLVESLTEELLNAERAAYGKLIRTIVHEVNNTLAGVLPLIDTCAMIADDESMEAAARSCTERCNALSAFIGNFADVVRLGAPQTKDTDINAFLLNQRPFLESLVNARGIELAYSLDPAMPAVAIDTVQFEQVIVNLVKNSAESIGRDGRIGIASIAEPPTLVISDNGAGISPEAAGKLFAPFFSTKKSGQGIGLTLSAEILRAHGFDFSLVTGADAITRFTIHLK